MFEILMLLGVSESTINKIGPWLLALAGILTLFWGGGGMEP